MNIYINCAICVNIRWMQMKKLQTNVLVYLLTNSIFVACRGPDHVDALFYPCWFVFTGDFFFFL